MAVNRDPLLISNFQIHKLSISTCHMKKDECSF